MFYPYRMLMEVFFLIWYTVLLTISFSYTILNYTSEEITFIVIIGLLFVNTYDGDKTRGCTGFDGGFEIAEAIRGLGPRKNLELNINADENLAYAA